MRAFLQAIAALTHVVHACRMQRLLQSSGGKRGGRSGGQYVPDHVRNPHKYTCYVLDEPIIVGGGDRGSLDGGQAEMQRVSPK